MNDSASRRGGPENSGISGDADLYHDAPAPDEPIDVDSRWLYKVGAKRFGPVTTKQLLERLYDGQVNAETPVAPEDEEDGFKALRRYGAFSAHLDKADSHQSQLREITARAKADHRSALKRRIVISVVALLLAVGGAVGTLEYKRRERIAETERARLEKEQKERELVEQTEALLARVTVEPALMDIEVDAEKVQKGGGRKKIKRGRPVSTSDEELTSDEIMDGVAERFDGIKRCIKEQIKAEPDTVPQRIVLSFTIDNDGHTQSFALDDRYLRTAPLASCLGKELAAIRYRKFKGEVRNVVYPLNIGRG
ncbi:MAG: DUF4339 domain-containing protein [Deltaproteobacteria bacterium]|nr:DUF4339 domain-containing protein [Deltaproteobacteria bacterium]